jgi:hypothetical protein
MAAVQGIEALRRTGAGPRSIQEHHLAALAAPVQSRLTLEETASSAVGDHRGAS